MVESPPILTLVIATVGAIAVTPLVILIANLTGFQDSPGGYKRHERDTPLLGGVPIVAGVILAFLFTESDRGEFLLPILCIASVLLIGAIDDRVGLPIWLRLVWETVIGVILFAGGFGWNFDAFPLGVSLVLTIVWVVGLVNAINLMDNRDGALGSVVVASSVGLAIISSSAGAAGAFSGSLALAGATLGFLFFNLAVPSRIFLGDSGSLAIGTLLAVLTMNQAPEKGTLIQLGLALLVVAVPILDLGGVVVDRFRRRVNVFQGERNHLPHVLVRVSSSARTCALILMALQGIFCGVAVLFYEHQGAAESALACGILIFGVLVSLGLNRHEVMSTS